jgi:hypothetical protein
MAFLTYNELDTLALRGPRTQPPYFLTNSGSWDARGFGIPRNTYERLIAHFGLRQANTLWQQYGQDSERFLPPRGSARTSVSSNVGAVATIHCAREGKQIPSHEWTAARCDIPIDDETDEPWYKKPWVRTVGIAAGFGIAAIVVMSAVGPEKP